MLDKLHERGQGFHFACIGMVEVFLFLHPSLHTCSRHHKYSDTRILGIIQLLPIKDVPLRSARKYDEKCLFEARVLPDLSRTAASATVRESFVVVTLCSGIIATLNLNYGPTKAW